MRKDDAAIALLLAALDEAFDRRSWHGTNLRGALRGLTAEDTVWRPGPNRHNIGELVVHSAYWKYIVRRAITGATRGSFPLRGSNWSPRNQPDAPLWRRDLDLLNSEHQQLRAAVAALSPARLDELSGKGCFIVAALIRGVAAHDLYHAGRIQLLKRLRAT